MASQNGPATAETKALQAGFELPPYSSDKHWDGRPILKGDLEIGRNEEYRPYITPRVNVDEVNVSSNDLSRPVHLPPGVSEAAFLAFLKKLEKVVGEENVETGAKVAVELADPFSPFENPLAQHVCSAVVRPATEEIQELVKLTNAHHPPIPFWTVSRGRNLGYGGSSPVVSGSICLNLGRMNKIIEVNEEYAYCIVEPGVTFFDLYDEIRSRGLNILSTAPGIGWGSIVGNTLDRGWGYTQAGNHSNQVAGLEVVLPDGDLVRTNMGAIDNGGKLFAHFQGAYGPGIENLFYQSNLGIVTKLALWLSTKPKAMYLVGIDVPEEEDLIPLVDICGQLCRKGLIDNRPVIGNVVRFATLDGSARTRYWPGPGAIPDEVLHKMKDMMGIGFWSSHFAIYGDPRILDIKLELIKEAFSSVKGVKISERKFVGDNDNLIDPQEMFNKFGIACGINLGVPSLVAVDSCKWRGEDCGHIGFSPILRPNGKEAYEYYKRSKDASAKYGFDFFAGLHLSGRHLCAIQMILYDRHDNKQLHQVRQLFDELLDIGKTLGVSEYRAHVAYMDKIAQQYDFNNCAQLRLQQKLKDVMDPNGILSPGKQGVWNSKDKPAPGLRVTSKLANGHVNGTGPV